MFSGARIDPSISRSEIDRCAHGFGAESHASQAAAVTVLRARADDSDLADPARAERIEARVVDAIANAVYHATGRRIRDVPITLDKLIG